MKRIRDFLRNDDYQSGQALVESALVVVVSLLLLAGLVEFGWAYFRFLAMQDAAGEGAAYGLIYPERWYSSGENDENENPDPDNIEYRTIHESNSALLDWSSAEVKVEAPFLTPGNLLTVTVTYDHTPVTPGLASLTGNESFTLRATAVQKIISPIPAP